MKNHLLFLLVFVFSVLPGAAQSLMLLDSQNRDISNDTLLVDGTPGDPLIQSPLVLHNPSSRPAQVWIRKVDENLMAGAAVSFCIDGRCFSPEELTMAQPLDVIPARRLSRQELSGRVHPGGNTGISFVTYEFFSPKEAFTPVSLVVKYAAAESPVSDHPQLFSLSSPSPNPAASFTSFSCTIPDEVNQAFLIVRDLTGRVVLEQPVDVNDNRIRLNVADLSNGIFLYSLLLDGQPVVTRKLIVSR